MNILKTGKYLHLLTFFALLLSSCGRIDQKIYGTIDEMVIERTGQTQFITSGSLYDLIINQASGYKIIDVREPVEYIAGHIPGAINIPRGLIEFSDKLTNRREKIILYSNTQKRACLSASNLKLLKFKTVMVLEGGLEMWVQEFPNKIEEGSGNTTAATPAKKTSSGGCGD